MIYCCVDANPGMVSFSLEKKSYCTPDSTLTNHFWFSVLSACKIEEKRKACFTSSMNQHQSILIHHSTIKYNSVLFIFTFKFT